MLLYLLTIFWFPIKSLKPACFGVVRNHGWGVESLVKHKPIGVPASPPHRQVRFKFKPYRYVAVREREMLSGASGTEKFVR